MRRFLFFACLILNCLIFNVFIHSAHAAGSTDTISINSAYLQYRTHSPDDGTNQIKSWISFESNQEPLSDDVITSIELFDDQNSKITINATFFWYSTGYYYGSWNADTHQVDYTGPITEGGYSVRFSQSTILSPGNYTYVATTAQGKTTNYSVSFPGVIVSPVISKSSIHYQWNDDGSFTLNWDIPNGEFDEHRIVFYHMDSGQELLYIKLPNSMNSVTIPRQTLGDAILEDDMTHVGIDLQTRSYDAGMNYARGVTRQVIPVEFKNIKPLAAGLIGSDSSVSNRVTYTWHNVTDATWYRLWVQNSSGVIHDKWYKAADVISGNTCAVTLGDTLTFGEYTWWVQTYNNNGYGPWSSGLSFSIGEALNGPPLAATLISPDTSANNPVTYSWNAVSDATWYQLWVNDSNGNAVHKKWYKASNIGCASGQGSCSVIPESVSLGSGSYKWWVQTWNEKGIGEWSSALGFKVISDDSAVQKPVIDSFSGEVDSNVTFSFLKDNNASFYQVLVETADGQEAFARWYRIAHLQASKTKYTITPDHSFDSGDHKVWIRSWNEGGYSEWSNAVSFTVKSAPVDKTSFSPITQSNGQPLKWEYQINNGNSVNTSYEGVNIGIRFSNINIEINSQGSLKTASFTGQVSGAASGSINVNVTEHLESGSISKVKDQEMDMDLFLSAMGQSATVTFFMETDFTPSAEWFLDRPDLDTLPIGYIYDEQGYIDARVAGRVSVSGYGSESIGPLYLSSAESWEIIDKLSSMTVNGTTYTNVIKVNRTTIVPDFSSSAGTESTQITYWVAKGIGMIKGIGQFNVLNNPLEIELVTTNLNQ